MFARKAGAGNGQSAALAGLSAITLACLFLPLLVHARLGAFSRYVADDFALAAVALRLGPVDAQAFWHQTWSGRFFFVFLVDLLSLAGPRTVVYLPAAALALWLGGLTWAVAELSGAPRRNRFAAFALAALLVYAALDFTPNVYQVLHWQQGMLVYVAPIIVFCFHVAFILWRVRAGGARPEPWALLLGGFVSFCAAGMCELVSVLQITLLGAGALWAARATPPPPRRRSLVAHWCVGAAAAAAALLLVVSAPGNQIRQAMYPPHPSPAELARLSWASVTGAFAASGGVVSVPYSKAAAAAGTAFLLSALFAHVLHGPVAVPPKRLLRRAALFPAAGFVLVLLCHVPLCYATSSAAPAARSLFVPAFVFVACAAGAGYLSGLAARESRHPAPGWASAFGPAAAFGLTAVLLYAGPVAAARVLRDRVPASRYFAATLDAQDRALRAARRQGARSATVTAFKPDWADDAPSANRYHWVNRAMAYYYGFESVVAK